MPQPVDTPLVGVGAGTSALAKSAAATVGKSPPSITTTEIRLPIAAAHEASPVRASPLDLLKA